MDNINISQIHPYAFAYPEDLKAMKRLKMTPFVPEVLRKITELNFEKKVRAGFMYNSIQVGEGQLESLYRMVQKVAVEMGVEMPDIYVSRHGGVNAFAYGLKRKSIVLTTSLLDLMTDDELRVVIAHELSHILCEHLLYKSVAVALTSNALPMVKILPAAMLQTSAIGLLYRWYRAAEYTADRASLLVTRDPQVVVSVLAKLAGTPARFSEEFSLTMFREQARFYEEEASLWTKLVTANMGLFLTHPEPVRRAREIWDWAQKDQYKDILAGKYLSRSEFRARGRFELEGMQNCPVCRFPNDPKATHCQDCGLDLDPDHQILCSSGHINSIDATYCHACRSKLASVGDSVDQELI